MAGIFGRLRSAVFNYDVSCFCSRGPRLQLYETICLCFRFLYAKVASVLWSKNSNLGTQRRKSLWLTGVQIPKNLASNLHADDKTRFEVLDMRRGIIKMLVACVLVYFVAYSPIQGIFIMTWVLNPFLVDITQKITVQNGTHNNDLQLNLQGHVWTQLKAAVLCCFATQCFCCHVSFK